MYIPAQQMLIQVITSSERLSICLALAASGCLAAPQGNVKMVSLFLPNSWLACKMSTR